MQLYASGPFKVTQDDLKMPEPPPKRTRYELCEARRPMFLGICLYVGVAKIEEVTKFQGTVEVDEMDESESIFGHKSTYMPDVLKGDELKATPVTLPLPDVNLL